MKGASRYFLFTSKAYGDKDMPTLHDTLKDTAKGIDAFIGYRKIPMGNTVLVKGFVVLANQPTYIDRLVRWFPNILLHNVGSFPFDIERTPRDTVLIGDHPFKEVRKNLFHDSPSFLDDDE